MFLRKRIIGEGMGKSVGTFFIKMVVFPFSLIYWGIRGLLRFFAGRIYEGFNDETAIYQPLLEGDFFDYTPEEVLEAVDLMDGYEFERFASELLKKMGFWVIEETKGSGDQGVDIVAEKEDVRYSFQCKHFGSKLGNTSVQEVAAGRVFYHCHVGVVLTNSFFTDGAKALAEANLILLWDRNKLSRMVEIALEES